MNALTPVAVWIGGISWVPRFLAQITAVDKFIQKRTGGKWSLLRLAGLPNLMLTVAGHKSGVPRTTPLLCVPYGDGLLIAGSNFGGPKMPAWVGNVRAAAERAQTVSFRKDAVIRAAAPRELSGDERAAAWQHMLKTWPNYAKYEQRTDRTIPVFLLEPAA